MLKKALLISSVSFGLINSSFATGFIQMFHPSKAKSAVKKTQKHQHQNYTDFTGTWTGRCDDVDETVTITVENDEDQITVEKQEFDLNGLNTVQAATSDGTGGLTSALRWNEDKTAIIINDVGHYHSPSIQQQEAALDVTLSRGIMELKEGTLILSYKSYAYIDGKPSDEANFVCRFTKQ